MSKFTFYYCTHCGNVAVKVTDSGAPMSCCGDPMVELKANSTDAAQEKHVPVIEISGSQVTVKVGAVAHPMEADHYIEWIALVTDCGLQVAELEPGNTPEAIFAYPAGKVIEAYAYCNKHGLWTAQA